MATPPKPRICKDCGPPAPGKKPRPAPHPGPRCTTHDRERKKAKRLAERDINRERRFGLTGDETRELKAFQDGMCICGPWTGYNGATRELSVDHDHQTGIIRGMLCKHCNDLLGRIRDDPEYFRRMIAYLESPPAVRLLGERIAPLTRVGKNWIPTDQVPRR